MNEVKNGQPDDAELPPAEALLPWYATGRLSTAERAGIEAALAEDSELQRHLAMAREEEGETIGLNESLRTPPAAAFDRLMAKIDLYEAEHPRRVAFGERAFAWLSRSLSDLSPRTLAWSATAAAVVICLQGGLLTGLLADRHTPIGKTQTTYGTASVDPQASTKGTYAFVAFVGTATVQDMTAFLQAHNATLVDGAKSGLFRIKIDDEKLSNEALNKRLAELGGQKNIVSLIIPANP